jgi:hypothetical protein
MTLLSAGSGLAGLDLDPPGVPLLDRVGLFSPESAMRNVDVHCFHGLPQSGSGSYMQSRGKTNLWIMLIREEESSNMGVFRSMQIFEGGESSLASDIICVKSIYIRERHVVRLKSERL